MTLRAPGRRYLKTSRNNCDILAFNEAPGAQLVEEGDDRRCILCDPDQEAQDDTSGPAPARAPQAAMRPLRRRAA